MAKSSSASGAGRILAKRYAVALIDVASAAHAAQAVEKDIYFLDKLLLENNQMREAVANPVIPASGLSAVLSELGARQNFHQLTVNFIGVLAANRRLNYLQAIIAAFRTEIETRAGIVEASVRTAQALSASQEETLARSLSAKIGKNVKLSIAVEPALLGGMVVTIGSTMVDDSVKSKLNRLQLAMSNAKAA